MCIAAAIGGAAVVGAGASIYAGNKAAGAQEDAAKNASNTQMQMYNQTRTDQAPWRAVGSEALDSLAGYYGLDPYSAPPPQAVPQGGVSSAPGYHGILGQVMGGLPGMQIPASPGQPPARAAGPHQDINKIVQNLPGYQFNLQQGQQAVQQNLAARGLLQSGAAGKALTQYGQGYASNAVNDYLNGLRGLAGIGQTATQATSAAGQNAANQIGSNDIYSGNAQASGYANTANAINSGLQGVVGAYGMTRGAPPAVAGGGTPAPYAYGYNMNSASSPWSYGNLVGP